VYFLSVDISPSTETVFFGWNRRELIILIIFFGKHSKPNCNDVSNDFSISMNNTPVSILLLTFKVTWSVSLDL
jgi:hypothetical protein